MSDLIGAISGKQSLSGNTSIGKGDAGQDGVNVFIKYADIKPTHNQNMKDQIGDWIGICRSVFEPTSYLEYQWHCIKKPFPINELLFYGDISVYAESYNQIGITGFINVFASNMVKNISGKTCLDCLYSDFEYPTKPRENYILFPSIVGRKYLFKIAVYGKTKIMLRDINTGVPIQTVNTDEAAWNYVYILVGGTGDNLYFALNSDYITCDKGYVSEFTLIDLTRLGEESLTLSELKLKYGDGVKYFSSDQHFKGDTGVSAYESAVLGGFTGTQTEFYTYLSRLGELFEGA